MNEPETNVGGERDTPLAIARELAPWCLAVIMAITLGWTALVAHVEVSSGRHDGILITAVEVVSVTAPASPLFVLYGIMITISLDFVIGGIMATARILTKKFVAPIVEAHREEGRKQGVQQGIRQGVQRGIQQGREQGIQQGREQGIQQGVQQGREQGIQQGVQQGREQMIAAVREWNDRRLDAQKRGIPFDEPPPGL